jgi:hypothetical protein
MPSDTSEASADPLGRGVDAPAEISLENARAIAKEAFVYGSPMVDCDRIMHTYYVAAGNPEYKAPWNHICNVPRVFTPEDKAVQTPNSDTPYFMIGPNLRAEPIVLILPAIAPERYFNVQLIDAYTHNAAYLGTRATGNEGGRHLVAGPHWQGKAPAGRKSVILVETELAIGVYRTHPFNPGDLVRR